MSIIQLSPQMRRRAGAAGFTLLELVVVISIVGILAVAALDRLFWYQGQAEKAAMEYTATIVKSALWMDAANLMMAGHAAEVPTLAERNPMNLLAQKPANYLGEMDGKQAQLVEGGHWFYDAARHELVYVVGQRRDFSPATADDFTVRYGMKVLYGEMQQETGGKVKYVAGITLVPLSEYTWH